ncbi:MAG TPA: DcrB-related protein [bacterium]|nr:DcrB-related protein [bacterium]
MRFRTLLTHGLAAVVCAILAGTGAPVVRAQVPLSVSVVDPQGRFAMNFPADWEVSTKPQGMVALLGAGPAKAGKRPTVNVVVEPLPNPMSAEAYAAAAGRLAKAVFHNYTVIQESAATVRGQPVYYRYFTWETNSGVALYQMQVFFTAGQSGFVVTGTTVNDRDRILQDMPLVTQIIETFRVVKATN